MMSRDGAVAGEGKAGKKAPYRSALGEQATVAQSHWEDEWQKWFWASKGAGKGEFPHDRGSVGGEQA